MVNNMVNKKLIYNLKLSHDFVFIYDFRNCIELTNDEYDIEDCTYFS